MPPNVLAANQRERHFSAGPAHGAASDAAAS